MGETTITPQSIAALMGVPMYPGASAPDDKTTSPYLAPNGDKHVNLVLTTKDAPEKVLAFFKRELPKFQTGPANGGLQAIGMSPNNSQVIIKITSNMDFKCTVPLRSLACASSMGNSYVYRIMQRSCQRRIPDNFSTTPCQPQEIFQPTRELPPIQPKPELLERKAR